MGNADTDPILFTETWTLRFDDHPDILVTVNGHHGERGVWYYAHSVWPGLDYELHMSDVTGREAVKRIVETGARNGGNAAGLCAVLAPGEVAEVERLRAEVATLDTVSERRRALLDEKARELAVEYVRAEKAEAEVTRLRAALDDVAHAHERDLMRIARALGFTHEPPSSVDVLVAVAESLTAMRPMVDAALATVNETKASLGAAIAKVERLRAELDAERTEHAAHEGTLLLERNAARSDAARLEMESAALRAELDEALKERDAAILERLRVHTKAGLIEG